MKSKVPPMTPKEKEAALKGFTAGIFSADQDKKDEDKKRREEQVAREAEERRMKETAVPPKELSKWQIEQRDLEAEGQDLRQPETVVMGGEPRSDWETMKK